MFRFNSRIRRGGRRHLWLSAVAAALVFAGAAPAQAAPFVYVTNYYGDIVSQYDVTSGGLLSPLFPPTAPTGNIPAGVAVSPDGTSVYVANQGPFDEGDTGDSVSQFDVGPGGKLSPKSPPTVAAGDGAAGVAVSPDGKSVYVTNAFTISRYGESISQYDVGPGGKLSPKSPPTVAAGNGPWDVKVSPDGNSVYVANFGTDLGASGDSISQYDVGSGGKLSPKSPPRVATGDRPYSLAMSPDGKNVYAVNVGVIYQGGFNSASVSQYDVGVGGALSPKSPSMVAAGTHPEGVAVSPDGKSVYVIDSGSGSGGGRDSVVQYDVGPNGALAPKSPPRAGTGKYPTRVAVSPDGKSVYVTNSGNSANDSSVSQYDVGAGGKLSPKSPPTVAAGDSPWWVAVSPVPTTKGQCKHGGWKQFGFKNQGQCIRFVKHGPKK